MRRSVKLEAVHHTFVSVFFWLCLIGFGFMLSTAIAVFKGYSLSPLVIFFKHSGYVVRLIWLVILSYQVLYFVLKATRVCWLKGIDGVADMALNINALKRVILQSLLTFVLIFLFLAYQTSFKTVFNESLTAYNLNDWMLYTIDQQIGLQQVGLVFLYKANQDVVFYFIRALDAFYMPSFAMQWMLLFYIIFNDPVWQRKNTFVACFLLIWIIGTMLGGICQSGGPFFFGVASRNLLLMDKLDQINQAHALTSVFTQGVLWNNYFNDSLTVGHGISAFPSLHVAMSLFVFLYAYERRCCQWLALGSLVLTWLASALLGWHYWVDGIGAVLIVMLSYRLAVWLVSFFHLCNDGI